MEGHWSGYSDWHRPPLSRRLALQLAAGWRLHDERRRGSDIGATVASHNLADQDA